MEITQGQRTKAGWETLKCSERVLSIRNALLLTALVSRQVML